MTDGTFTKAFTGEIPESPVLSRKSAGRDLFGKAVIVSEKKRQAPKEVTFAQIEQSNEDHNDCGPIEEEADADNESDVVDALSKEDDKKSKVLAAKKRCPWLSSFENDSLPKEDLVKHYHALLAQGKYQSSITRDPTKDDDDDDDDRDVRVSAKKDFRHFGKKKGKRYSWRARFNKKPLEEARRALRNLEHYKEQLMKTKCKCSLLEAQVANAVRIYNKKVKCLVRQNL